MIFGFVMMLMIVQSRTKPNILFILADDLGFGDVSWNNPDMLTPNLETLARTGVILDQYYTQPKCSPSRAALLTGLYPYKTSMQRGSIGTFRPSGLPTNLPILPGLLRKQGYRTHLVGKWHLGYCNEEYLPTRRGFDSFFGEYSQQADHYDRTHEVTPGIGAGYDLRRGDNVSYESPGLYSTFLWEQEAKAILDNSVGSSVPWFLELSLTAVHPPYQVPEEYILMYDSKKKRKYKDQDYDLDVIRKGMVTAIDDSVGRIVNKLKALGLYDNTIIVFSSDNGSGYAPANGGLRGKKGTVFEGGVRVPAFITGPPLTNQLRGQQGYTSSALVHIVDWFPTLLRLGGLEEVENLEVEGVGGLEVDGLDLWQSLIKAEPSNRSVLVYNIDIDDQSSTFQLAIRSSQWKLIWGQTKEFKSHKKEASQLFLFNLDKDPGETTNLAQLNPAKVDRLKDIVKSLAKNSRVAFHPGAFSLGYPRYHNSLLEPGWCGTGWWNILWRNDYQNTRSRFIDLLK